MLEPYPLEEDLKEVIEGDLQNDVNEWRGLETCCPSELQHVPSHDTPVVEVKEDKEVWKSNMLFLQDQNIIKEQIS